LGHILSFRSRPWTREMPLPGHCWWGHATVRLETVSAPVRHSSQRGHTAVHEQQGAGDVGGIVGGQKQDRGGDLLGLPGRFSIVTCAVLALYCSTVSPEAAMRR
jgi:hypothetical protein